MLDSSAIKEIAEMQRRIDEYEYYMQHLLVLLDTDTPTYFVSPTNEILNAVCGKIRDLKDELNLLQVKRDEQTTAIQVIRGELVEAIMKALH